MSKDVLISISFTSLVVVIYVRDLDVQTPFLERYHCSGLPLDHATEGYQQMIGAAKVIFPILGSHSRLFQWYYY
jgi:hypothetical protein